MRWIACAIVIMACRGGAGDEVSGELGGKLDAVLATYANTRPGPGCAVGVFRAGAIVYTKGFGLANLEHGIPIDARTLFEVGSMSKQFTAAAIVLLAQDHKLALDDDVRTYIPELPDYGHRITLRHLLHHTGGLREYDNLLDLSGYDEWDAASEEDVLRLVTRQAGVNFPAGTQWRYSNTGYFLLSIVVKRVTGMSLAQFAEKRLFQPLGMRDTFYLDDHTRVVPRRATGYSVRPDATYAIEMSARDITGEGNVQTTIQDLARWDENFYTPRIGGAALVETMRTPGTLDDGTPLRYAMGLRLPATTGVAEETHGGAWAGYRAIIRRFPTERLTVACLCNRADANPWVIADAVAAALLPARGAQSEPVTVAIASPDLAAMAGAYIDPASLDVLGLYVDNGALHVRFGLDANAPGPPLDAIGPRKLVLRNSPIELLYEPAGDGHGARVVYKVEDLPPRTLERFTPVSVDASHLAELAGRYTSDETTHDLETFIDHDALHMAGWGKRGASVQLQPVLADAFLAGSTRVRFERDARGQITGMVSIFDGFPAARWVRR